ncbi:MAG TPA: IMP dehydrogenase [Candidatus Levybacteria bacterium]|nr:IMP dehydrogenase [Candidatus Levybacteria bacterium]
MDTENKSRKYNPTRESLGALTHYVSQTALIAELLKTDIDHALVMGEIPLISTHDHKLLPEGTRLIKIPEEIKHTIEESEKKDIDQWNTPEKFLERIQATLTNPINSEATSPVMRSLKSEGQIVSFDDLRTTSPSPEGKKRISRSQDAYPSLLNVPIMGQGRMPIMLGAVPDVASRESYRKAAQSGVMVTASRDKIWGDPKKQALLIGQVIDDLRTYPITEMMTPTESDLIKFWEIQGRSSEEFKPEKAYKDYIDTLRNSWIKNVGAAIEASPKGIKRSELLLEKGCTMFRIYSPEGGHEIVETVDALRKHPSFQKNSVNVIAGQIMDVKTARAAVNAGCDSIIIGVAGGSQCTTSINADIPVNTPNLLYDLREANLQVPIGIEGGGVGSHMITALSLGAHYLSKPGEIGVSIAGSGKYVFEDPQKNWWVLYGGEASNSAKTWRPDSFDEQGRIRFPEGEGGVRMLCKGNGMFEPDNLSDRKSITRNIERILYAISVGLVFQRVPDIKTLHARESILVDKVSPSAGELSNPYAR